jgi:hypothetical protein
MISRAFAILLFLFPAAPARADLVADWNRIALDMAARSERPLEYQLRAMATVHAAMFETLNYIQGGYRPHFVVRPQVMRGIPPELAAAAAAHRVLGELYPAQALPPQPSRESDDIGAGVAAIIGTSIAGVVGAVALDSVPPRDLLPAADTDSAPSPLSWNSRVAELASAKGMSPIERARLHALVSMAIVDAYAFARESGERCAPCIATPAAAAVLEAELGTQLARLSLPTDTLDQDSGRQIGRHALRRYSAISPAASSPAPAR